MPTAWLNGRLLDGPIPLDPLDRGLTLGDGLFETIAVFGAKPAYLAPHLDRLEGSAKLLGIAFSRTSLETGVSELLDRRREQNGILRVTLTRGSGARGLAEAGAEPTILMTLSPWQRGLLNAPVALVTSSIRRNEHSPASRLKSLSYMDNILAAREARRAGADDALLLNMAGRVACSTISNLFLIKGPSLLTPPVSEGVLPGIIRGRLLVHARASGLVAEERPLSPADILSADAVFLTNSVRLIRPVTALDGTGISQRAPDSIQILFDALCQEIARNTGIDPRQSENVYL